MGIKSKVYSPVFKNPYQSPFGDQSRIMTNWGREVANPTNAVANESRLMGGMSDDVDNMILQSVSVFVGPRHGSQVRLAVYQGGALDNIEGARLIEDLGKTTGSATDTLLTVLSTNKPSLAKNIPTWIGVKGRGTDFYLKNSVNSRESGDFQTERGRWSGFGRNNPEEPWADPAYSEFGDFRNFWTSIFLTYSISINISCCSGNT